MLSVTNEFKNALKENVKSVTGYVVLEDGTEYYGNEDSPLQKFTITSTGGFLKTAMSKISLTLLGEHRLTDQVIEAYYGVHYEGEWHYALKGKFIITEATYKKDKETTELIGYDNMLKFQTDYTSVGQYPTTLYNYLIGLSSLAGVIVENDNIYNGSLSMPEDYYQNLNEYTLRDVLEDICEASASHALINPQGNLELRQINNTGEELDYALLKPPLELGERWGDINSLVLSRQPQNDDWYVRNDNDINRPMTRNLLNLTKFRVGYTEGGA